MKKFIIKAVQIKVYILSALLLRVLFRIKREGNIKIKNKKYIIASNHPSRIDPFLILVALPLNVFLKLVPIRFVTSQDYLNHWYQRIFLLPLGCISTKPKNNKKSLEILREKLMKGETIFIFPKGELEKRDLSVNPKVGAVYLERKEKKSRIIPVKSCVSNKISLANILKRNIEVKIRFKKIFKHKDPREDLQILANNLMEYIENGE